MLDTEKLDRLQKRLEFWDRPGNPITVNDGLELVALARKGLEAERLEREADWLADQFRDCPDEMELDGEYWDICKMEDCKGVGKEDMAACWRRAARKRAEASHV